MATRQKWPSRYIYILAAIGCAAGLGNFWRFPMLAYEYGGSAFIIALLISNILIVYPLVMFETIIGQRFQAGAPKSMEKLKKGTAWIQWIPLFALIFILMYYAPIMAWGVKYLFQAFSGEFLADPSTYFATDILHLTDSVGERGMFNSGLFQALLASYAVVAVCMWKGIGSVSHVVKFTATAPFILLFILLLRGVTLPGAEEGLRAFFVPDWSALKDIKLWQAAIGQSFFSASLAFGYFTMAGSHRSQRAEVPKSSIWIIAGNFGVSLLAGIAVFSTLGFMALQQGVPVSEAAQGGPMLAFSVMPTAISMMPAFKILLAVLLFLVIITLAIDSIFGIVESISAGFLDLKKKYSHELHTTLSILLVCFLGGIPFMFGAGLYYLDILDHFVGGYLLVFIGFLECFVAAYLVGPEKIRGWINETNTTLKIGKTFNYLLYIIPIVLGYILFAVLGQEFKTPYEGYPAWALTWIGGVPLAMVIILSLIFGYLTSRKESGK